MISLAFLCVCVRERIYVECVLVFLFVCVQVQLKGTLSVFLQGLATLFFREGLTMYPQLA